MDCNSYSYAPTMLQGPEAIISRYENDDMQIELEQIGRSSFSVWAFSYDGGLDVYEEFYVLEPAQMLYDFIRGNYSDTPPGPELTAFIEALPDRYGNKNKE